MKLKNEDKLISVQHQFKNLYMSPTKYDFSLRELYQFFIWVVHNQKMKRMRRGEKTTSYFDVSAYSFVWGHRVFYASLAALYFSISFIIPNRLLSFFKSHELQLDKHATQHYSTTSPSLHNYGTNVHCI